MGNERCNELELFQKVGKDLGKKRQPASIAIEGAEAVGEILHRYDMLIEVEIFGHRFCFFISA